jgi:hypothetical protein
MLSHGSLQRDSILLLGRERQKRGAMCSSLPGFLHLELAVSQFLRCVVDELLQLVDAEF